VYARKIVESVSRLKDNPKSGRIVPEFEIETIREIIVGNYRIIYLSSEELIQIIAVIHGARLLDDEILHR
jgi:plasmid stabilization system protein ParE